VITQADFDVNTPSMVGLGSNSGHFYLVDNASQVFEGSRSGLLQLGTGEYYMYFKDENNFNFASGNTIFLELNYSCNTQFSIGLIKNKDGNTTQVPTLIVNATTTSTSEPTWNKIYVDLGYIVQQNSPADFFELYWEVSDYSSSRPINLYLDNIKVLYFQQ
jgi:hypothetical protein